MLKTFYYVPNFLNKNDALLRRTLVHIYSLLSIFQTVQVSDTTADDMKICSR